MTKKNNGVAFFDFDGTIIFKDSFLEFIKFTEGIFKFYLGIIANSPFILCYYLNLYPNYKLKERFFSFFYKGRSEKELTKKGIKFGEVFLNKYCYADALKLINWHQQQNHTIYILTASSKIWLGSWCKNHQLRIIGTEFELLNGYYTGKIKGKNCYGTEKLKKLRPILKKYDRHLSFGYGDSIADTYFLAALTYNFNCSLHPKHAVYDNLQFLVNNKNALPFNNPRN